MCFGSYRAALPVDELIHRLVSLSRAQHQADFLICRYLADLSEGMTSWSGLLIAFGDVYGLARYKLKLSRRATRERIRVGKALRRLPAIAAALASGELTYSRVREVTRVADPTNEAEWLAVARSSSIRSLERRVRRTVDLNEAMSNEAMSNEAMSNEAMSKEAMSNEAMSNEAMSNEAMSKEAMSNEAAHTGTERGHCGGVATGDESGVEEVSLRLPAHVWETLRGAMQAVRATSASDVSDAEAIALIATLAVDALRAQSTGQAYRSARADDRTSQRTAAVPEGASEVTAVRATHSGSRVPATAVMGQTHGGSGVPPGAMSQQGFAPGLAKATEGVFPHTERNERAVVGRRRTVRDTPSRDTVRDPDSNALGGEHASWAETRLALSTDAVQILSLIRGGGCWTSASLCDHTGLSPSKLAYALTDLELAACVRRDLTGTLWPIQR